MSEPNKYREWILETIDSLRSRKARPDLERICRMVRRRHGSDPDRTRLELEKLIQEQTVLKVSYKGSISYRNAAKVQRKGRRRAEWTATNPTSNNGDSAHSFTDPEEGEEDPGPGPEPSPKPIPAAPQPEPCDGTCAALEGKGGETSAPRDGGSGQHGAEGCPRPGSAHTPPGAHGSVPNIGESSVPGTPPRSRTCTRSTCVPPRRPNPPVKPKLKVAAGSDQAVGKHAHSELARSAIRGATDVHTRSSGEPLGLKDILGYLSSQERFSEEKLTRGNVKVVMEREVARGRLRRTRCGNITLPLRGAEVDEPRGSSGGGVAEGGMLDQLDTTKPSHYEKKPFATASQQEESRGNEEEEEDSRSSDEEEARLSPVAMTTEPDLISKATEDAEIQTAPNVESPPQQHRPGKVSSCVDLNLKTTKPSPAEEAFSSSSDGNQQEATTDGPEQVHSAEDQKPSERTNLSSSGFGSLECKTEVSVSSCLLTPTASPRDLSVSDEQGFGVVSTEPLKSEAAGVSPVDWTVSDVVQYFTAAGYPEQALAFRNQEIDGKSLLLMQRNDVLTGLSIKLGPALKIFERHVKVLQRTHFEDEDS